MSSESNFRSEVRSFLAARLDPETRAKVIAHKQLGRDEQSAWHTALYEQGWVAPSWPREHGGTGWTAARQLVFDDECAMAGAPETLPFGLRMLGPVLMEFGTAEQRARYLPAILDGSHWWCQGFSEPGAGSDLAVLSTTARPVDGGFEVSGTKLWTTFAHRATHMFLLARTGREQVRQRGISFLLTPMDAPGVTVRPLHLIDGSHEVNEVVLDDVFVPADAVVGTVGDGWRCAKALLVHERMAAARAGKNRRDLAVLLDRVDRDDAARRADTAGTADTLLELALDAEALGALRDHYVACQEEGIEHGAQAPALKLATAALTQAISRTAFEVAAAGRRDVGPALDVLLTDRKFSIFGGSTPVQKDLAAAALWSMGART